MLPKLNWRTHRIRYPASVPKRRGLKRRLILHHAPLFLLSVGVLLSLYFTRPYKDVWARASFATAYSALFLLLATLAIGPLNILARRRNPGSSDLRRDIGIWAGILTIAHTVIGQNVHMRGRPWLYYVYDQQHRHTVPIRHDVFGFSNYTGLICTLLVVMLLATSNDYSLRRLGTPQWKSLQRWNYAAFALAAAHAVGYLTIEHQHFPFVLTISIGIVITAGVQTAGYLRRRGQNQAKDFDARLVG